MSAVTSELTTKPSELGSIPNDWECAKISQLAATVSNAIVGGPFGSDLVSADYVDKGVPVIRGQNMSCREVGGEFVFVSEDKAKSLTANLAAPGDIVFTQRGTIGQIAIVPTHSYSRYLVSQSQMKVTLDSKRILPEYFLHAFSSEPYQRQIALSTIQTGVPHLNLGIMKGYSVVFPIEIAEQRAIAEALRDVDTLLEVLDRMLTKKRDLKQAAMQQLLTRQTRLPEFNGEWEECEVKDVIERYFCGPSPTCEERNVQGDEWGVLKTTAATKQNGWDWTKHKTLPRVFWDRPHLQLQAGDVIVTKAGPRHRCGVAAWVDFVPERILVSGKMIGLRPTMKKVVPLMLAAAISGAKAQRYLNQRTTGMAEAQVNFENVALLETPISLPDFDEQTAIAEVLFDMDAEIAAVERRREKTQYLKQGMMQELLTGKTRLI